MNCRIHHCCWSFLVGLLASVATAQDQRYISSIPELPATRNRIVDVTPKSPFRDRQPMQVEAFDRVRALAERQQWMLGETAQPATFTRLENSPPASGKLTPISAPTPTAATLNSVVAPSQAADCVTCEAGSSAPARRWRQLPWQEQCAAAREMHQHHQYQAPHGGMYYFRPYQAGHIGRQAEIVGNWGGDRRNPYDNRFLQAIYAPRAE